MVCVESDRLRFVDITNFIAPGSSYASYLTAFGCSEEKGFFPYEWMDSLDKLNRARLPPKHSFVSSLTGKGISDADYEYCLDVWRRYSMREFRDFLVWYNNRDVAPFLEALEKQSRIYVSQGIDLLKSNVSLPGAAMRWMLSLCDKTERALIERRTGARSRSAEKRKFSKNSSTSREPCLAYATNIRACMTRAKRIWWVGRA